MKTIKLKICIALLATVSLSFSAFTQNTFFTVSADDDSLRLINLDSGIVLKSIPITLTGYSVNKATGLAIHPITGTVYALLILQGQTGRELATIDTATGIATDVGNTGDKFAGISFNSAGVLYGVTGDGATTPESLYSLNISTGAATFVMTLGNGDDGEVIAYTSDDALLYHLSGIDSGRIFETIDPQLAITNIPYSGVNYSEATALLYVGNGNFILASWNEFYNITTSGVVTIIDISNFSFLCKGIIPAKSSTTGINETSVYLINNFKILPNPFSTQTILQTANLFKNVTLTVYNSFGQQVKQINNITGQTITLHRDNLPSGLYFIRLTENNKNFTDKLIPMVIGAAN